MATLDQLTDQWEPVLRRAFLETVRRLADDIQIKKLVEMIEKGDVDGALRAVGLDPVNYRPFDLALLQAYEAAGTSVLGAFPSSRDSEGLRIKTQFDVRNVRAEQWLRLHSATVVRDLREDQREGIRSFLEANLQRGSNPRVVALDLAGRINPRTGHRENGIIGLTLQQVQWILNYALELDTLDPKALTRNLRDARFDRSLKRAIDTQTPLSSDLRAKMLAQYRNRAIRYRAETIALTETMTALHEAQDEAMRQAIDAGQVKREHVVKIWRSARDARVRDTHRALDGKTVPFDGLFQSPSGAFLRFPGDPQAPASERIRCRCWLETSIDFLAEVV